DSLIFCHLLNISISFFRITPTIDIEPKNLCSNYIDKGIPVILWATMYMNTPYISSTWTYNGKTINWIAPEHCLLLVGYDSSHYIFNDPLTSQPQTYYSKSSVETAYKGLNYQAIVLEKKDNSTPTPTPAPVYKYGAVKNPETKEIYPIMLYENGKTYIQPAYQYENKPDEKKPTRLQKNTFDVAKFISGLEFDDSMVEAQNHPAIGNFSAILIGGITSFANSWETLYMDVEYYKVSSTGQKQAVIRCGESKYCNFFNNLISLKNQSMRALYGRWSGANMYSAQVWESTVNDFAKGQYAKFKGIIPNDSYKYDIEFTFDERRKEDKYVSQIFCGKEGKMYEYATIYDSEKIEIVVKDFWGTEIDRINILPQINPVSELPQDKAAFFEFVKA
uniref:C39 family peptidase n=1 Tax=uncultured Ruminococcus sp. TaxID=165186 RepID=UPI0025F20B2C